MSSRPSCKPLIGKPFDDKVLGRDCGTCDAADGHELGSFTLSDALDAALVDDRRVYHGVTAVMPLNLGLPAHRDVLVLTLRAGIAGPTIRAPAPK